MRKARAVRRQRLRRGAGACCAAVVVLVALGRLAAPPPRFFSLDDDAALRPLRRPPKAPRLRGGAARTGRLAFLFLVRSKIPTEPVWAAFFREAARHSHLYGVYSHPEPGHAYGAGSLFRGTEIRNRTRVDWGAVTVARAEVFLLRAALADPRNERFLLVSESCVPLHPFLCLYDFLFSTPKSFVKSWATADRARLYDFGARDAAVKRRWRKGHQWVGLARPHAALVASTGWYEALEAAHAASAVAAEFRREFARQHRGADADSIHHCFADEHLVATVLANEGVEAELVAASPTLIRFGAFEGRRRLLALDINGKMKRDWRATSYDPAHITPAFLADARAYCDYGPEAAPLAGPDVEPRRRAPAVVPWANDSATSRGSCAFRPDAPSPCHLLLRKIPKGTVPAYARALWGLDAA